MKRNGEIIIRSKEVIELTEELSEYIYIEVTKDGYEIHLEEADLPEIIKLIEGGLKECLKEEESQE